MNSKQRQFIFFCGKGGVGKTTCASATAVRLSQQGYKTLLFSTDPAHSISDSLEANLTSKITQVKGVERLYAIEIDASSELKYFIKSYQKEISDFLKNTTYLDNEDIDDFFLTSLPGVDELMAVKKMIDFLDADNDFLYFVCDTAPTGHALQLISMPDTINKWIKALANIQWKYRYVKSRFSGNAAEDDDFLMILKKIVTKVKNVLKDPYQAIFNVVTIPEAMAALETKRLITALNDMGIKAQNLIINNIILSFIVKFNTYNIFLTFGY